MTGRRFGVCPIIMAAIACGGSTEPGPTPDPPASVTNVPGTTNRSITVDGEQR